MTEMGLLGALAGLTNHHLNSSEIYRNFVRTRFPAWNAEGPENLPFLPVTVFKNRILKSVPDEDVLLYMYSSGTSSRGRSTIAIDRETSALQTKSLAKNFETFFGKSRLPMIILGQSPTRGKPFLASDAAFLGFRRFATDAFFAYDQKNRIDLEGISQFLANWKNEPIVILGFTFTVWGFLDEVETAGMQISIPNATILHGGGWKKLEAKAVNRAEFQQRVSAVLGTNNVTNYYGMVEQTGSVFFECEKGSLHAPSGGEVLVRNPITLIPSIPGESGLIQVFSSIQRSYPGHSLLTEDVGLIVPDCGCGRASTAIRVLGRLQLSEIRGCSDAGTG